MELFEAIQTRQSCRSYQKKDVEQEKLVRCMQAVRLAPSACNSQPWSFIVVNNPEVSPKLGELTRAYGINKFTVNVPAYVVVVEEPAMLIGRKEPDQKYAHGDVGIAVSHLCLSATAQGLSTCILGSFDAQGVRELLEIPQEKTIRLVVAVGYADPDDKLREKKRKSLDEFVRFI